MVLLRFLSAIIGSILMLHYFDACIAEDMKTTLLGSDLFDLNRLNLKKGKEMRYRLLSDMNDTLFIGGQNELKTILIKNPKLIPDSVETEFTVCDPANDISCTTQSKGDACFNYIRVFNVMNDSKIFVCGSNALYPRCYYVNYDISDSQFQLTPDESSLECNDWQKRDNNGIDFTPFNWDSEMVQLFSNDGNEMFSGGSRKGDKRDSVICHIYFADGYPSTNRICTAIGSEFLNKASYVGKPIKRDGHTYFFYREVAEEYINHGKIIYSRVGRICNDDEGGTYDSLDGKLISFIKARLDCSISGADYDPFFFNELKDIYQTADDLNTVYAVFTTPKLGLQQSAVCRFDLRNIEQMMNEEMFRGQEGINNLWLPVTDLEYRPGVCTDPIPKEGYERYWEVNLINPLVLNRRKVNNIPTPMYILQNAIYTSIVVEDRLLTGKQIYILGTDNSTVFMAYINEEGNDKIFHKIDLKKSDEEPDEVTDLSLHYYHNTTFVYGTTNGRIFGFQLANCGRYTELPCSSNPYCSWSKDRLKCFSVLEQEEDVFAADNDDNTNYEEFTSKAVCENDTVVLKFTENSPTTCLKRAGETCRFYLMATVKNSNEDVSLDFELTPLSDNAVTYRGINGTVFKHMYYTIDVTVGESTNYTFQLSSTTCSLQFQVSLDDTEELSCSSSFCEDVEDFDEKVEEFRYCMYRWPQDHAETCQSRIMRQEKKGVVYFPRTLNDTVQPC